MSMIENCVSAIRHVNHNYQMSFSHLEFKKKSAVYCLCHPVIVIQNAQCQHDI
jgi:hypothetical protein